MAEKKFITCDGNYAAAHIAYMFSEVAAIYPITPSSTMAELVDEWAAQGRKNIFGETVNVVEMQSEAGAAGALHGSLQSGALTSTFTASQGLLLMIPNMYKLAGELLPAVFHVTARSLAAQALSIFGDHQDVMATRQTGFAMLATSSVQEVMDLAGIAHIVSLKARIPFMHFFDGFRTSHEIQKIELMDEAALTAMLDRDALKAFRSGALNPEHPVTRGTAQNPDIYFQTREASNKFYDVIPDMVAEAMVKISDITGREYKPFTYYGAENAENIVIAMGSISETLKETVDYLLEKGEKVGVITVHLYRPFSVKYLLNVLPSSVKRICVLDRTKEPGANGEPLYLDVVEAIANNAAITEKPLIIGGRYGLSSKDTMPSHMIAVYDNLAAAAPKNQFTVGIVDDVTNLSLPVGEPIAVSKAGTIEALFFGLGADGTVGANKNSIKIIGNSTDKYCQAYFSYDSKKSGGYTSSHLRFGDSPIRSPYLVTTPDFVACHVPSYVDKYDVLKGLKKGGSFLLNSVHDAETTSETLPDAMKVYLAKNEINFYIINATKIASELGLGNRTNTIMQSAFFKIANVIPFDVAVEQMKKAILKSYGNKGEDIVNMNYSAVDAGSRAVEKIEVPAAWANLEVKPVAHAEGSKRTEFVKNIVDPINALKGDDLPVSAFNGREDGTWENGTAAFEKRGIATFVPTWKIENCIQCNQCAYVCPHAAIRPFLATEEEAAASGAEWKAGIGETKEFKFRIQVSPYDCAGCNNCVDVCPSKEKALVMRPLEEMIANENDNWEYLHHKIGYKGNFDKTKSVKNLQFTQPLFEFSGACAGCGETPYIKTLTQLFGDKMMVANATGCTSIFSGSAPSTPYCTNEKGQGPAWANSLFEDNAEFGLGMHVGVEKLRDRVQIAMEEVMASADASDEIKATMGEWIATRGLSSESAAVSARLLPMLEAGAANCDACKKILEYKDWLAKKSQWIIGGDGWGYDIGFGGVDHVLASGMDVNILVVDTEVYSNTGGQSSKSTPVGAVAKFASSGKRIRKKDLGAIAMTYGYVYVAQVSIGASQQQLFKIMKEAEAYQGPSLIIAYAPCINHGIKGGMTRTQTIGKEAVACGYWHLWHYNPMLENEGKNPFVLDSKAPDWSKFQAFLMKEIRYTSLKKAFPAEADELFAAAEDNAKWRYNGYDRLAKIEF